jgi:hypothetical protein
LRVDLENEKVNPAGAKEEVPIKKSHLMSKKERRKAKGGIQEQYLADRHQTVIKIGRLCRRRHTGQNITPKSNPIQTISSDDDQSNKQFKMANNSKCVLVMGGGGGYIGTYTIVCLLEQGYNVVLMYNMSNLSCVSLDAVADITKLGGEERSKRLLDLGQPPD